MSIEEITSHIESYIEEVESRGSGSTLNLISLLDELAFLHHANGKLAQAEKFYLRSLSARESYFGLDDENTLPVLHRLGVVFRVQGKFELAELFYLRSFNLTRKLSGDRTLDLATRSNYLAGLYLAWSKYKRVKSYIDISISLYREHLGEDHVYVGFCLIALSINLFRMGESEQAEICLDVADSIIQPLVLLELAPSRASLPALVASLSLIYCRQRKLSEAEILFRYALMQEAREIWPAHPSVGSELDKLSKLYRSQGRIRAADFLVSECVKLKAAQPEADSDEVQETLAIISDVNRKQFEKEALLNSLKSELKQIG